jgi:hypothetical protein
MLCGNTPDKIHSQLTTTILTWKTDVTIRTYSELQRLGTYEDRYKYLALRGKVGELTFGVERYLNQKFYTSYEWRHVRNHVIVRDSGCDLGSDGYEIHKGLYIHHMNPLTVDDVKNGNPDILDPEFLITCTHQTHNAIHYGDARHAPRKLEPRRPGDTKLW